MNKESYTVKEIADIIGVSKTTIQKYIKASAITYDYVAKNKQYYSIDKTKSIIKGIRTDFNVDEIGNRQPQTDNIENENITETQSDSVGCRNCQPPTANQKPQTENRKHLTENRKAEEEIKTNNIEKQLSDLIDTLQKQLEIKDEQIKVLNKQLEVKDEQIKNYSDRLSEALQLTAGQQFIHAVDKKEMLKESKEENTIINVSENINQDTEEKSIIKRLFNIFK